VPSDGSSAKQIAIAWLERAITCAQCGVRPTVKRKRKTAALERPRESRSLSVAAATKKTAVAGRLAQLRSNREVSQACRGNRYLRRSIPIPFRRQAKVKKTKKSTAKSP
jgi:hypothetical protein